MATTRAQEKVVRAQAKGQITIPSEFRSALGIEAESLLNVSLVGDHLEITPLVHHPESLRRYTDEDIERFLEEDKLDEATAQRVRSLLARGEL